MPDSPILWPRPWEQHFQEQTLQACGLSTYCEWGCAQLSPKNPVRQMPAFSPFPREEIDSRRLTGFAQGHAAGLGPCLRNLPIQFLVSLQRQIALNTVLVMRETATLWGSSDPASSLQAEALCRNPEYTVSNPGGEEPVSCPCNGVPPLCLKNSATHGSMSRVCLHVLDEPPSRLKRAHLLRILREKPSSEGTSEGQGDIHWVAQDKMTS